MPLFAKTIIPVPGLAQVGEIYDLEGWMLAQRFILMRRFQVLSETEVAELVESKTPEELEEMKLIKDSPVKESETQENEVSEESEEINEVFTETENPSEKIATDPAAVETVAETVSEKPVKKASAKKAPAKKAKK